MKLNLIFTLLIGGLLLGCQPKKTRQEPQRPPVSADRFESGTFSNSRFIEDKAYRVFLPKSYRQSPERRYPVLYMMDLQNLFVDSLAYGGVAWNVQYIADSLVGAGAMEEIIIVGLAHAGEHRFSEYMPQRPVESFSQAFLDSVNPYISKPVYSDDFLSFLVEEFKPFMDATYRTQADIEHSFIAGSSMGGLISMYALCEYPEVFGGALCLSTHWAVGGDNRRPEVSERLMQYLQEKLPAGKKWYFDHGTEGLDQHYEVWQDQVDSLMEAKGYVAGKDWLSRKFEGHHHNESYWQRRVHIPLSFAFGTAN
jgi:enterochelin esterase-like enzyme